VNWIFVYSKFGNQDYYEAADAENYLREASKAYGIQYKEPYYVEVQSDGRISANSFCDGIIDAVQKVK
jgi:L-ribulose-5-phosphate 3-epimerase UlaE